MNEKKGPLQKIVDAVEEAVQAVAVGVGLTDPEPVPTPKPRSVRKSARKAAVAKVEQARTAAKKVRTASHRGK